MIFWWSIIVNSGQTSSIYRLSIVIVFYNMRREAERTLFSLTRAYQKNIDDLSYEVIVIDNGSTRPLDKTSVESLGENFRYIYFDAQTSSPAAALNYGAEIARGDFVMLCIDGARILSPGILHYSMLASKIDENPFVYTLAMHIGHKPQPYLVEENYSQIDEDLLLSSIDWKMDGYSLFDVSSVALSSGSGYFSKIRESNCVVMLRSTYQKMGGFDQRFRSAGGGFANLEFFNRANLNHDLRPIMLLGEATFHQFHGGITTNVGFKDHPKDKMMEEYRHICGKPYQPSFVSPIFFGNIHSKCKKLLLPA